ncbi:GNAT family N-acetyltransferase [Marinimicrobium alkaliphilum]|uniref:GNAT family N-acetyltransferase n=1 Tax=Marinimicrobium alkaliphilum TaxID=2202654 RepID=UPI000DB9870A|nr:GNAT family N-acetyltransferase [Marinimicrobium alkaliphilum]
MSIELITYDPDRHYQLVANWMRQPEVARWWGNPQDNLFMLRGQPKDQCALICNEGTPVGYLSWQQPSESELRDAGLEDLPLDMVDVDIMIGDTSTLGKGVGPKALAQLFRHLAEQGVPRAGIVGAVDNLRAMRAYAKAGLVPFRDFYAAGKRYRYFTKVLNAKERVTSA